MTGGDESRGAPLAGRRSTVSGHYVHSSASRTRRRTSRCASAFARPRRLAAGPAIPGVGGAIDAERPLHAHRGRHAGRLLVDGSRCQSRPGDTAAGVDSGIGDDRRARRRIRPRVLRPRRSSARRTFPSCSRGRPSKSTGGAGPRRNGHIVTDCPVIVFSTDHRFWFPQSRRVVLRRTDTATADCSSISARRSRPANISSRGRT